MSDLIRKGSRGDAVKDMQEKLNRLGFDIRADGIFGDATEAAVLQLQTLFGYNVDGLVGPATKGLIDQQLGYGWNRNLPDAAERALAAQGKGPAAPRQAQQQARPASPAAAPSRAAKPAMHARPGAKG